MIENYRDKLLNFLRSHQRLVVPIIFVVLIAAAGIIYLFRQQDQQSQVGVTPTSGITHEEGRTFFSLTTQKDYLYKAKADNGRDAAVEFIKTNPTFNATSPLFPEDYAENASIIREEKDMNDPFLRKNNILLTNEHYFFDQKIDGIPVYNATVVVHVRNNDEVYATTGTLSTSNNRTEKKISEDDAVQAAVQKAQEDSGSNKLKVVNTTLYYFNEKLIGLSDDTTDTIALKVEVETDEVPMLFKTDYFVSLTDGTILYEESQTRDAIQRNINDCSSGSCALSRGEGSSPVADSEVNNLYTHFGTVYDFFSNKFGRDSYDGNGAPLNGYVNAPTGFTISGARLRCPNAFWNGYEMVFCTGLVLADVTGHELSHGVISRTANLQYLRQSGALNESIADIFGSEIDKNWEIGEGLRPGTGLPVPLRSMNNPTAQGNPDKLSSSLYYCGTGDNGGVHKNSGVINKTYYLMVDGGNYNGCSINGVGRDKAINIVYQALTKYLTATSNFKDAYNAFLQSCSDLFGSGSSECENVGRALQATELDQQAAGSAVSPICQGGVLNPPACASSGGAPTVPPSSPIPSATLPTGTTGRPTPTPVVGSSGSWNISVTSICEAGMAQLKIDYDISSPLGGFFQTIDPGSGAPTGIDDISYISGSFGSPLSGKGTYVAKGNFANGSVLTAPVGLKKDFLYLLEVRDADSATSSNLILSLNVKTVNCSTSFPGGPGTPTITGTPTPSPTPRQMFTCQPDPRCANNGRSIQLCPLVCQPVSSNLPAPTGGLPTATGAPSSGPTAAIPTTTIGPTTALTPTTPAGLNILTLINSVSESSIRSFMESLVDDDDTPGPDETQTRYTGTTGLQDETQYVSNKFSEFGLASSFQNFSFERTSTRNVIGRIEGQDPNSVYLVTSHIDSTAQTNSGTTDPAPGADDNASGTVVVMEAARVLKSIQPFLKHSIEFITFSGEEQGLYGSYYYVNNRPSGKTIKGVINLDMVGNSSGGECVNFMYKNYNGGDALSNRIVQMISAHNLGLGGESKATSIPYSDHKPFWDVGIPAIFATECAFSPVYHSINDKMSYLNFSQLTKTTKAIVAAVADLATQ